MKNIISTFHTISKILLISILFISFSFKTYAQKKVPTTLSVKIKNYKKNHINLIGFKIYEKVKFNTNTNSFIIPLEKIKKGNYNLAIGKNILGIYLDSKNDFFIQLDGNNWKTHPIFKGDKSLVNINNYLQKKQDVYSKILHSDASLFIAEEGLFIKKMNMYKHVLTNILQKSKSPKYFNKIEKKDIYYRYLTKIKKYETYHKYL